MIDSIRRSKGDDTDLIRAAGYSDSVVKDREVGAAKDQWFADQRAKIKR